MTTIFHLVPALEKGDQYLYTHTTAEILTFLFKSGRTNILSTNLSFEPLVPSTKANPDTMEAERPVMYLEHEDWSPRYQDTFYTFKLESFELLASPPPSSAVGLPSNNLGSRTSFPAYYYKVEVFCGRHPPRTIYRRYSQFKWLCEKLRTTGGGGCDEPPGFPPPSGCLWSPRTESLARGRLADLRDFLTEALTRKGIAGHEMVAEFLELDAFLPAATEST